MGKLPNPDHQLESVSIFNTFDPCVLDDDAVLILVGDVTVPDPREALHDMGNPSKYGVGIVLVTREDLETNVNPFFLADDVA